MAMIDGNYNVTMQTPMGKKNGELTLQTTGNVLTGKMVILGKNTELTPGKVNGKSFQFNGELHTAVGRMAYTCNGTVTESGLTAMVETRKGKFLLNGVRK